MSATRVRAIPLLAIAFLLGIVLTACRFGMDVDCGPLGAEECGAATQRAIAFATQEWPGAEIAWIKFRALDGAYTVGFADGTSLGVTG